jgi:ribosomal protein L7/L12
MQKLNKDIEQQIIALVKNNKPIEAVSLVHNELKLGLKESKDIVDKYRGIR